MHQNEIDSLLISLNPFTTQVHNILNDMPLMHQLAFAAYCSEIAFSFYKNLGEYIDIGAEIKLIRDIIDRLWRAISTSNLNILDINEILQYLVNINFGEEDYSYLDQQNNAIDAIGIIYLSIEACKGNYSDKIACAVSVIMNIIYRYLQNKYFGKNIIGYPEKLLEIQNKVNQDYLMLRAREELLNILEDIKRITVIDEKIIKFLQNKAKNSIFYKLLEQQI